MEVPTPETGATMPIRSPDLQRVVVDDEQVVHDPVRRHTHRLNPTAALVLDRCDGVTTVEAVCRELAEQFGTAGSQIAHEVTAVLAEFERSDLVSPTGRTPRPTVTTHDPRGSDEDRAIAAEPISLRRFITPDLRALDATVRVTTDDPAVARRVDEVLGSLATGSTTPPSDAPEVATSSVYELVPTDNGIEVRYDGQTIGSCRSPDVALSLLVWHLNGVASRHAAGGVLLHASAVLLEDDRVALFPGEANAGKSTLVAGLVHAGFGYLTDETVAVDPASGLAEGYRKPISLDPGSWALFPEVVGSDGPEAAPECLVDPRALHPDALARAARGPVGLVVFPTYTDGSATSVERLSRPTALVQLVTHATNLVDHRDGLAVLAGLITGAAAYALTSGDLREGVSAVADLVVDGT